MGVGGRCGGESEGGKCVARRSGFVGTDFASSKKRRKTYEGENWTSLEVLQVGSEEGRDTKECESDQEDELEEEVDFVELDEEDETDRLVKVFWMEEMKIMVIW